MPETEPTPAPQAAPATADDTFPANTPVAEMTAPQQAAYWRDKARKHEDRVKSYGGVTPEKLTELQERASQWEVLAAASQTDQERAVTEARQAAASEAAAAYVPRLVAAEFRATAAGRIEGERLATILEPLDLSKFLTDNGDVDTAKVAAFVDGIAPARGEEPPARRGPTPNGLGRRESAASGASVAAGRDLYRSRNPQKTS